MNTLIINAYILTMDAQHSLYQNGFLKFEDGVITAIGAMTDLTDEMRKSSAEVIDADGGFLMPGMINTHTHVGMIPFRSLGDDVADRLRRFLFPLESNMKPEIVYHSTKYAIAEMLLAGVTTFSDMYYFEDEAARATDEMHSRAFLGETVIDMITCDSDKAYGGLEYCMDFVPKWQNHPLITPMIAPHATNTNSREVLRDILIAAKKWQVPIMMHVAEMDYEMKWFADEYRMTPIEYLDELGYLDYPLIAAHCIHLSADDLQRMANGRGRVAHCIGANTKAAKGIAPIKEMLNHKIKVGLGTDGPSSGNTLDLFAQMKLFANFQKNLHHDRTIFPAEEIMHLATLGGAEVLGIEAQVGSLEVGKKADLTLIETRSVNMFPIYDPYAVVVYSANASNVEAVWVAGRQLVRAKNLVEVSLPTLRENLDYAMKDFREGVKRQQNQ